MPFKRAKADGTSTFLRERLTDDPAAQLAAVFFTQTALDTTVPKCLLAPMQAMLEQSQRESGAMQAVALAELWQDVSESSKACLVSAPEPAPEPDKDTGAAASSRGKKRAMPETSPDAVAESSASTGPAEPELPMPDTPALESTTYIFSPASHNAMVDYSEKLLSMQADMRASGETNTVIYQALTKFGETGGRILIPLTGQIHALEILKELELLGCNFNEACAAKVLKYIQDMAEEKANLLYDITPEGKLARVVPLEAVTVMEGIMWHTLDMHEILAAEPSPVSDVLKLPGVLLGKQDITQGSNGKISARAGSYVCGGSNPGASTIAPQSLG